MAFWSWCLRLSCSLWNCIQEVTLSCSSATCWHNSRTFPPFFSEDIFWSLIYFFLAKYLLTADGILNIYFIESVKKSPNVPKQYYKENLNMTFDLLPDWHRMTFFLTFLDTSSIFFISASWKNTLDFPNWNKTMKISCQSYRSNLIQSHYDTIWLFKAGLFEWVC